MLNIKKVVVATVASVILLTSASPVLAEDKKEDKKEVKQMNTLEDTIFKGYRNKLDDGSNSYYYLDVTTTEKADDDKNAAEEAIENTMNVFNGNALEEKATNVFYEGKNMMVNLAFRMNVFIVTALINGLNMVFDHNIVEQLIDAKTEQTVQAIVGIDSSGNIKTSGLIGQLMPVITSMAVIYGLYLFAGKRAQLRGFQSIGNTVLVLVFAIGFFANYGSFLKGMNQISTDLSQAVLAGPAKALTKSDQPMAAIRDEMFDNIWDQFVHRPYMFMQYGTDEQKDIGKNRVETLLKKKPGDSRLKYIEKNEVSEKKNINMTYANVDNRIIFTGFYTTFNTFNGIPFVLLMIALEACQFAFLGIAMIAPFVFIWSAFPNQIGVLKRFGFWLSLPLLIKIGLSLITLMYFTISTVIYKVNSASVGGYIESGFMMVVFLFVLVLLWYPIKRIFGASKQFNMMIKEANQIKHAIHKQAETVTKITGTVIGAAVGGPQGAAIGGNLGGQFAHGLIDQSDDTPTKDENSAIEEKTPTAELPEFVPPEIVDWKDNHHDATSTTDLPDINQDDSKNKEPHTGDQEDERLEYVPLPPLNADEEKEYTEIEAYKEDEKEESKRINNS